MGNRGFLRAGVKTEETHRANIMHKLDFHSITELVQYAVRNHIILAERPPAQFYR